MKKFAKIVLVAAALILVAGMLFAGAQQEVKVEKATIRYADTPYGDSILNAQKQFLTNFAEDYPNIEVKVERTDWGDFEEKYLIQAAAGTMADVFYLHGCWWRRWFQKDQILDLTPYIERDADKVELDDFFDFTLDLFSWKGRLYGLPMDFGPEGVHAYSVKLFREAGISPPTKDWTFEKEFFDAALKLTKDFDGDGKTDQWGYVDEFVTSGEFANTVEAIYLNPWGGWFINEDETECLLTEPKAIKALQWWVDLARKHKACPTEAQAPGNLYEGPLSSFGRGKVGMMRFSTWTSPEVVTTFPDFEWDVMHAPKGPVTRSSSGMGSCFSIYKKSKHPEEAWIFLREMENKENLTLIWALSGSGSCARKSAWKVWQDTLEFPKSNHIFYEASKEYMVTGRPITPPATEVLMIATREWNLVMAEKKSVEEAVKAIKAEADPLLVKNK